MRVRLLWDSSGVFWACLALALGLLWVKSIAVAVSQQAVIAIARGRRPLRCDGDGGGLVSRDVPAVAGRLELLSLGNVPLKRIAPRTLCMLED